MGTVIVVLGVIGIVAALTVIVETGVNAVRKRRYVDLAIVLAVAALAVWLLLEWGDVLLR
jgi:hypothetical protein